MTRLLARRQVTESGCWLWIGKIDASGYGEMRVDDHHRKTHRIAYELVVGPIPEGFQIDHLCRVRACFNPDHLEAVTPLVNMQRSECPSSVIKRTGKCMKGHEMTRQKNGLACRVCHNEWTRRWRAARKAS